MRLFVLAATLAAVAIPASAASAHDPSGRYRYGGNDREVRQELRECRRELRRADSRRGYRQELRECRRELRQAQREARREWRDERRDARERYYDRRYSYREPSHRERRYWDGYRWRYRW